MATYRKRKSGRWQAQVRRKGYPAQNKSFRTKALAEAWVRSIEVDMDQGMFESRKEAESTTLGELLERYLRERTPKKKGAEPEACRIGALKRHPLAKRYVASVRSTDIAQYRDERLKKVSSGSVRRELTILSQIFEVSRKEWEIFVRNPVREITRPEPSASRHRRLECETPNVAGEESRLLSACRLCRNPNLLPVVRLAIETAMRQSELVGLKWENISFHRRTVFLPRTKNGDSRSVPLSTEALRVLRSLPRSINGDVFPGLTTMAIKKAFNRAARRAEIEDFHFHDLRHEATSRLFEIGLNIMEVATITGHKDLRMLRRYTHLKAEDLAKKLA